MAKNKKKTKKRFEDRWLVGRGTAVFNDSSNWREEGIEEQWMDSIDQYDSKFPRTADGKVKSDVLRGAGKLFIPKTYSNTQRMHVDIMGSYFFDREEIVSIIPWKTIPRTTVEIVKALLNYRLNGHPINFYKEAFECTLDSLKVKVGIAKVWPKFKTKKDKNSKEFQEYTPIIEALPYEDVFFSQEATWKDYYKYPIVHRFKKSLDYLKRRGYKNLDQLEGMQAGETTDEIKNQRAANQNTSLQSPFTKDSTNMVDEQGGVYVFEIWDFLDVDSDGFLESCSYLMAGDERGPQVLIRDVEENDLPYEHDGEDYNRPPFVVGQGFPEPHQMYGKDVPELMGGLQRETNALRNQRREAVALAIRKPLLASRNANLDLIGLSNRKAGKLVLGDDISPSSVRELDISDPTSASVIEQERTDRDIFEVTSIPPDLQGIAPLRDDTATGVTSRVRNANKKIEQVIANLGETFFIPTFQMLLRLEQKYVTDEFIEMVTGRVLGWQFLDDDIPTREFIQGDFELVANTGVTKAAQINKFFMMLDRAPLINQSTAQMLQLGVVSEEDAQFIDSIKIYEEILKVLGEKDMSAFTIKGQQPLPAEGGAGVPGVGSQARLPADVEANVLPFSPEGVGGG